MLILFRWLLRLTVALIALSVIAGILAWYFAVRSLPDYNADYPMRGLTAPVEIVRSTENVPHIFGATDHDVFFALGVAHAQDRLFQMTMLRRAAQGRLAEVYGAAALPADDLARRLGLFRHGAQSLEAQDPETQEALRAYSAGVNEWIAQVNEGAMGRGAPEFFLFPQQIAYWQPADSLAILKLLAASTTNAAAAEVFRARLSLAWPEHGPEILGPAIPGSGDQPRYADQFPGLRLPVPEARRDPEGPLPLTAFLRPGAGMGANSFAAGADRTAAHGSLLANDPHTTLTVPSLYYLARLQLQSGGAIGATIPGMPVVFSGRTPQLAWGVTPARIDDSDLYIEEVQPGNADRYRGLRGWTQFDTRTEVIRVLDAPDQTIVLRETENGPIVSNLVPGLPDVVPLGHVAALRWTGLSGQDQTMSGLMGLMRAASRDDAARAATRIMAPALQVTLADTDGVQALTVGALPQRTDDSPTKGSMPTPGWLPEGRWTGIATAAATQDISADTMIIATDEDGAMPRRGRLDRLLDGREVHSRDSFISVQLDVVSPAARALLPVVGANLWFTGEPAAKGTPERQRQDALGLLAEWDGDMSEHLPEPLIYAAWMRALQDRLIRDELGPLADDISRLYPGFIEAVFRNRNGAGRWCDIVQSAPTEDCDTIARQSLDRALLELGDRFGPDVTSWRWGDMHQAQQDHPALGQVAGLGWIMNLTQPVSGGSFTVAESGLLGCGADPYEAVTGAGYRGVYDLADPDNSVFVIATGQSGHPFSRHYDDLAGLWRRGEYVRMSLDPDLARAAAVGITRLTPAP
ncbi:penicillin acylase family protein [Paracoccus homiensis]|uniref:Penicillin amidase n=1 Tax=Paracoccus homiensis TaxID=364199 RepID=A0A1I0IVC0_9RHOB|nr:penicillin acylase family protein [Paracoccus homiensis]SEU01263.1 penicillin amidase [Paracoccus homiensis]